VEEAVNQVIEARELFTLNCQGAVLHGTFHKPPKDFPRRNPTGILYLGGFPMPRAAHGDAAVYWAASFANLGYPSFRIDLPGAGDSSADVPAELLRFINTGGHERVAAAAVKQLVERYNLSGLVILGHCAGAISAIFAAAICEECRGLIFLDPPFHLPPAGRSKVREVLFHWSTRSRIGGLLSNIHDQINNIRLFLRRNAPPENTNFPLLKRWKDLASGGLPILLLIAPPPKASATKPRVGKFDYLRHVLKLAGNRSRVDVKIIESAHHTFSDPVGRDAVRQQVEQWMPTFFPFENLEHATATFAQPAHSNNEAEVSTHQSMFAGVNTNREVESLP
jgi:pimeloyl-ACP methyl ester carboxylesterase